jgi:hypothetical protein
MDADPFQNLQGLLPRFLGGRDQENLLGFPLAVRTGRSVEDLEVETGLLEVLDRKMLPGLEVQGLAEFLRPQ